MFLPSDDKKGVDRASTVIARDANEGNAVMALILIWCKVNHLNKSIASS